MAGRIVFGIRNEGLATDRYFPSEVGASQPCMEVKFNRGESWHM